ncbi:MAG: AAA domain-containing protein [Ignavibacteriales bacterium]|nr:AAA domain-containing protein [Ignavibacteriales bacterium]
MNDPEYSTERKIKIEKARLGWINRLIDKSRRNNLLYYKDLKTGTLMLGDLDNENLRKFFCGASFNLSNLFKEEDRIQQAAKLREIIKRNTANVEEKGLQTLFMAIGLASWDSVDGGIPTRAPLVLFPLKIEKRGREQKDFLILQDGDPQFNIVLIKVLEDNYGVEIDGDAIIDTASNDCFNPAELIGGVIKKCNNVPGFKVEECAVIGNFSFQKMAMVRDLQDCGELMISHDLIAAIAGDLKAQELLSKNRENLNPIEFDKNEPKNELLIIDADSSQQNAILAIRKGQNGVVQGPPGTGKSQTIANTIAALVAEGKKVLFVAEKRAALEVVKQRLERSGLEHLALDFHGADFSPRRIIDQLNSCLDKIKLSSAIDSHLDHQKLINLREKLNKHVQELHKRRTPSGFSIYQLQGKVLLTSVEARLETRWNIQELKEFTPEVLQRLNNLFIDASGFEDLFLRTSYSKWNGAKIPNGHIADDVLNLSKTIFESAIPNLEKALQKSFSGTTLIIPTEIMSIEKMITIVCGCNTILKDYKPGFFRINFDDITTSLKPLEHRYSTIWHYITDERFRKSRKTIKDIQTKTTFLGKDIFKDLRQAKKMLEDWRTISKIKDSYPTRQIDVDEIWRCLTHLAVLVKKHDNFFEESRVGLNELNSIYQVSKELYNDSQTVRTMPKLYKIENEISSLGANELVSELRRKKIGSQYWTEALYYIWYQSCLDDIFKSDADLSGFKGSAHSKYVEEFKNLDKKRQKIAEAIIRHNHASNAIKRMNNCYAQTQLIQRESQKRKRLMPLRKLLAEAEDVVTALFPCWMASPLSISQVTKVSNQLFDVVLFDEASQVLPEDAIPAILRAKQVVVAGDRHQLPPTTFFASIDDDTDKDVDFDSVSEGYESILDLMTTFLEPWWLEWHYRSKDERLIAFSNHHIYSDRLVSFPSAREEEAIRHVLVEQKFLSDIDEDSSSDEVKKVVELIMDHAEKRPNESLGVITMGLKHAKRLEAEFEKRAELRADLDSFFSSEKTERFFIKNLERVQGDERDAIIISIGYGKDRSGKLPHRFGPLLFEGGERRLNVAVTRARNRCTLVSSFSHHDIDLQRAKGKGIELLHHYIEFMQSDGKRLSDVGSSGILMNEFEKDVYDTLGSHNIRLIPQYGSSKYRIDFAVVHPDKPGQMIMALECDGAAYHSSPTATERDRIRQNHLEALGWNFYRIWSTDWFLRKHQEKERFLSAYGDLMKRFEKGNVFPRGEEKSKEEFSNYAPTNGIRRGNPPRIAKGIPIDNYRYEQLVALIDWIMSDGMMRTDQEIINEAVQFLGYKRTGSKIQEFLKDAIKSSKKGK